MRINQGSRVSPSSRHASYTSGRMVSMRSGTIDATMPFTSNLQSVREVMCIIYVYLECILVIHSYFSHAFPEMLLILFSISKSKPLASPMKPLASTMQKLHAKSTSLAAAPNRASRWAATNGIRISASGFGRKNPEIFRRLFLGKEAQYNHLKMPALDDGYQDVPWKRCNQIKHVKAVGDPDF